jgi:hypothetical protein
LMKLLMKILNILPHKLKIKFRMNGEKNGGHTQKVPDKYAGKTVKCPKCKASVKIGEQIQTGVNRYSLAEFVNKTSQKEKREGVFELESNNLLEINLDGVVWTKMGSMVAYKGEIKFTREGVLEHGIGKMLKKAVSGEGCPAYKSGRQGCPVPCGHWKKDLRHPPRERIHICKR